MPVGKTNEVATESMVSYRFEKPSVTILFGAGGLLFILLGLCVPLGGIDSSLGSSPIDRGLIAAGERLFRLGLLTHGLLCLTLALLLRHWPLRIHSEALCRLPVLPESVRRDSFLVVAGILIVAVVLRGIGLNGCLWFDEVSTLVNFVRLPYAELVRNYAGQNQHPLYSVLARAAVLWFGESAWALRLPAVIFGVASLWVLYRFAAQLAPRPEPLLAMALLAVAYQHVWFSQNARGYTALLFWTTLGSWLFVRNLDSPRLSFSFSYATVMALATYTHLTAAFFVSAHALIYLSLMAHKHFLVRNGNRADFLPLAGFVLWGTLSLQLYSLVLPQVVASIAKQTRGVKVEAWTDIAWGVAEALKGFQMSFSGASGAALAAGIVFIGLISYLRTSPLVVALLVLPCALGLTAMILLQRHLYPRFFFPVLGLGAMIVVRGAMVLGENGIRFFAPRARGHAARAGGLALAGVIILVSGAALNHCYRYPKQDYVGALQFIDSIRSPNEAVVAVGMAILPTSHFYGPDVEAAQTANELEVIRTRRPYQHTWLIYTFPDHVKSFHADLWEIISQDYAKVREFPGTVGGGSVYVCRGEPIEL